MLRQIEKTEKTRRPIISFVFGKIVKSSVFLIVALAAAILLIACQKPSKIDLRTLAPNDALIYLETDDLAAALDALTENAAFQTLAGGKTDFSAMKNIQTAIVVSDFGTAANEVGADTAILNFKPHFVAVAETRLWSWQTNSLVENQINKFAREKLGENTRLEKSDKYNGKFYVWTATDNRQIFALAQASLLYFGNDENLIEKCAAVKNGAVESLAGNEFYAKNYAPNNLASGYVSPAGVEKIAALAGIFAAAQTNESDDGKNFIARVLPQILQNTTEQVIWTARKTDAGIEDDFKFFLKPPLVSKIKENFVAANENQADLAKFLPADFFSATRYRLKNPLAAWRNSVALVAENTDALSAKLLARFSGSMLEPYGIANAEQFLNQIKSEIIVARFDENGDQSVVVARVENIADLKKSLTAEIKFNAPSEKSGNVEIFFSEDKNSAAAFLENVLVLGNAEAVKKCLQARQNTESKLKNQRLEKFINSNSLVATFGKDADSADRIARVLTEKESEKMNLATFYLTETNFSEAKVERRSVSDFGLIGTILKQLAQ